jgi:hypothetical protein
VRPEQLAGSAAEKARRAKPPGQRGPAQVRSVLVEAPAEITGLRRLNYWATTAIYNQGHSTWLQLQRAGGPNTTTFWDFTNGSAQVNINATVPLDDIAGRPANPGTGPASGVWGQLRDQTAAVVAAGGTFNKEIHGRPTALAYGAWVADTLFPNVLPFIPGTNALWDPWQGSHNGKGLTEDSGDNVWLGEFDEGERCLRRTERALQTDTGPDIRLLLHQTAGILGRGTHRGRPGQLRTGPPGASRRRPAAFSLIISARLTWPVSRRACSASPIPGYGKRRAWRPPSTPFPGRCRALLTGGAPA